MESQSFEDRLNALMVQTEDIKDYWCDLTAAVRRKLGLGREDYVAADFEIPGVFKMTAPGEECACPRRYFLFHRDGCVSHRPALIARRFSIYCFAHDGFLRLRANYNDLGFIQLAPVDDVIKELLYCTKKVEAL